MLGACGPPHEYRSALKMLAGLTVCEELCVTHYGSAKQHGHSCGLEQKPRLEVKGK